jgi:hypothetical protein
MPPDTVDHVISKFPFPRGFDELGSSFDDPSFGSVPERYSE